MTDKNDNPESNADPSLPDQEEKDTAPASDQAETTAASPDQEKDTAPASDQETVSAGSAPEASPSAASPEAKPAWPDSSPASKSSFTLTTLLLVLTLGAVGGGGYWIFEEQKKLHQEVQAGFNQMTLRLDTIEADMQRLQKNQQQLEAFNSSLQAHQSEVAETFKSHQNSLSTLDEDVLRMKEELHRLAITQTSQPAAGGDRANSVSASTPTGDDIKPEPSVSPASGQPAAGSEEASPVALAEQPTGDRARPGAKGSNFEESSTIVGDNTKPEPSASPANGQPTETELTDDPERSQEAQEYIDFVESTTAKFFRLVKEGLVNLWQWFASLFTP